QLEEAAALQREIGDRQGLAGSLAGLGAVALRSGRVDEAQSAFLEALRIRRALGERRMLAETLERMADVEAGRHRPEQSAWRLGAAASVRATTGMPLPPSQRAERERRAAALAATLGMPVMEQALASGAALSADDALRVALGETPAGGAEAAPAPDPA